MTGMYAIKYCLPGKNLQNRNFFEQKPSKIQNSVDLLNSR